MTVFLLNRHRLTAAMAIAVSIIFGLASLASCGGGHNSNLSDAGNPVEIRYSDLLRFSEHEGFTEVTVRNPWDTVRNLHRYLLVHKDSVVPPDLPKGTLVRTPLSNALVYSTVHAGLIRELDSSDAIGGMCSVEYVKDSTLKKRLDDKTLADCGLSQNPNIERIIALHPDAILLSPYENNDQYAKVATLGIPVIECADYMETSPLGRAEWMRFYGLLFGVKDKSEKMFEDTESNYLSLKEKASKTKEHPTVLIDQRYGQVWNVPCGNSTTGRLIEDAGGVNPFADYDRSGSVALAPEKVLASAHDADIWLLRYNQDKEKSLEELAADAPVNSRFKALSEGNVYGCNTRYVDFYEETPFHPDWLLKDYILMLHPGLLGDAQPHYYKKMK